MHFISINTYTYCGDIMRSHTIKKLIYSFCSVAIFVLISMILTKGSMNIYEDYKLPKFAPPSWIFPIAWSMLYLIIAITVFEILENKKLYLLILINLFINILWPVFFFRFKMLRFSIFWLVLLILQTIVLLYYLFKYNRKTFYWNIPYFLWLCFALYLNITIYVLNK